MLLKRQRPLPSLSWQLTLQILGLVLLLVAITAPLFYFLHERPIVDALAETTQAEAIQKVEDRLESQFRPVESMLRQSQAWGAGGLYHEKDLDSFNRLMAPVVRNTPFISSVVTANELGEEILLIQMPGGWKNRLTRVEEWGKRQQWLDWKDGQPPATEWKERDYDPRKRPWYLGAVAGKSLEQIHWSLPYILVSTGEAAISASALWRNPNTDVTHVIDFDVTLADISRLTRTITIGKSGYISLLSEDGKVIGLPHLPAFANDDALRSNLLKKPQDLGLGKIQAALDIWKNQGGSGQAALRFDDDDGEGWIGSVRPLKVGTQTLTIVAIAPASDFSSISEHLVYSALLVLLAVVVISYLIAHRIVSRVKQPLQQLAKESARIGDMQLDQPVSVDSRFREIVHLTEAQEHMRLLLLEARTTLEEANHDLEEKIIVRTHELEQANDELATILQRLRETQAQLIQSEKLSALGALVAGVSHELNTPIGNCVLIASTVETQQVEFEEQLKTGLRRSVLSNFLNTLRDGNQILQRNLKRAAELVHSFKQIAVDQSTNQRRLFDLRETVHETQVTLTPMLNKAGCRFVNALPQGLTMDSYPGPLIQIITNLTTNAIAHGFEHLVGGEIHVSLAADAVAGEDIRLLFKDNGQGIAEGNLSRIFDPFFTTKLGHGGSGLGLNIVYNLVTRVLGGSISVSSEANHGTCFEMVLPRTAPRTLPMDQEFEME
ncbi:sensor histidine kinase [Undibacterium sp.]|jgi:signal transduction histidine kinase|uniref:sensor histidine kinase n=1 Tax=Undibacterium sp. TaxID=1914977 RepID=UPI002CA9F451|nr:sensor histidine kinase [Undibacterium sp.]HTD06192.1 sensor histidine kinase [Undibacterium sp.]